MKAMCSSRSYWIVAVFSLSLASFAQASRALPQNVRLTGHVLTALSKAKPVSSGPNSEKQRITLTVVLRRDDQAGFDRYLHDLYDSHSKIFRRYLSQKQVADRFGPSAREYDSVESYLRASGFRLVSDSKNRLTLTVSGTRAQTERAFGVRIRDYKLGDRKFYANDRDPALPSGFSGLIETVQGLNDLARPRPARTKEIEELCEADASNGLERSQATWERVIKCPGNSSLAFVAAVCQATEEEVFSYDRCVEACGLSFGYNDDGWVQQTESRTSEHFICPLGFPPQGCDLCITPNDCTSDPPNLQAAQVASYQAQVNDGTGQKIGLLEFDTFHPSDVANWLALIGYQASVINNLSEKKVGGGASIGAYEDEVLLDIDGVLSLAPGAQVVVYDTPFTAPGSSFQTLFNAMINDGDTIISNSWFYCENQTTAADVNSIDSILASAAASGITVLNATGDSGSVCGAGNSIAVPADSPHATAVGGSSVTPGPGGVYGSETWWDTLNATPPGGAGGFGVSQFFSAPSYQAGVSGSASRSVPDLVLPADPAQGVQICQADAGGCPTPFVYGGTSNSTPMLAGMIAEMNSAMGHNVGELNPQIYPLANTKAFHNAAALSSSFAEVGLGSPNMDALELELAGQSPGVPDAAQSLVSVAPLFPPGGLPVLAPADGATQAKVVVKLVDANDHSVPGKTVTLSPGSGASATISPSSAVSDDYGNAVFTLTDLKPEVVTMTATDTTDAVTLNQTETAVFLVPPATTAGLTASPSTVTADGVTQAAVTLTLQDSLGRPTPGKVIQLSQNGNAVVGGPNPPVTDSNGQIVFAAVDNHDETVTFSAVDITDGNLPFPQTGTVSFSNSPAPGCVPGNPVPAPGYVVVPVATGFQATNFSAGGVNWGACPGAFGPAFDASGNMYVSDFVDGYMYKFPLTGGVANSSTRFTQTSLPTLAQPVFSGGNLYVSQAATGGGQSEIWKVDLSSGALTSVLAPSPSGIICGDYLAADPVSGDLFSEDAGCGCTGAIWRVSNPGSGAATLGVYATLPTCPAYALSFSPGGDLYAEDGTPTIYQVSGTSVSPTTVTPIYTAPAGNIGVFPGLGLQAGGTGTGGSAQYVFFNQPNPNGPNAQASVLDLTASPPTTAPVVTLDSMLGNRHLVLGPDGCLYGTGGTAVFKITDTNGACTYTTASQPLTLTLSPQTITPNPAQGAKESFTASFHFGTVPDGTPVHLTVTGANPQFLASSTVGGSAPFSYTAVHQGIDTIIASAVMSGAGYASEPAVVTYGAGQHATFLTLNASPDSANQGAPVNLSANLTDYSVSPLAPLSGQTVAFSLGGGNCSGATDANGNATCQITPSNTGLLTLSASYAGNSTYLSAADAKDVNVIAPTATPTPTGTGTCPKGQGYWKNHPKAWKLSSLQLGTTSYTEKQALIFLSAPVRSDASLILADQLTAALLSIANGSNPSPISATISDADGLLGAGPIPEKIAPSSKLGQRMVKDADVLNSYNSDAMTPGCTP
jgi:hypothetical protein